MSDSKKKSRLGRGLNSLMGFAGTESSGLQDGPVMSEVGGAMPLPRPTAIASQIADPPIPRGTPAALPIDSVIPNPRQPRQSFDDASLADLADSIKANGVIQPIVVRAVGDHYELIAGERRLRASRLAKLDTIPAFIRDADELEQAQLALVENVQREDLNAIDRAAAYHTLIHELGLTQAELGSRLGENGSVISNHLRLLELPDDVKMSIKDGDVTLGHAKVLAGVKEAKEQSRLARLIVSQSLSVRNLERVLAAPAELGTREPPVPTSAHVKSVEVSLTRQIGLRVQLKTGSAKSKGKVVIHYKTLDEFDSLVERLGATLDE